jgi:hypothetical protein
LHEPGSGTVAARSQDGATYLAFVDQQIAYFERRANHAHHAYNALRIGMVVLGAVLPAFTSHGWDALATGVAVVVATIAGLEALFKPGDIWRLNRSTELELRRLKRRYCRRKTVQGPNDPDPDDELFTAVEELLAKEPETFWNMRIAREKAENK